MAKIESKPKLHGYGCPFCAYQDELDLKTKKFKHIPRGKNYIAFGDWWYYECPVCKQTFTTTESDNISIANFKHKKL